MTINDRPITRTECYVVSIYNLCHYWRPMSERLATIRLLMLAGC